MVWVITSHPIHLSERKRAILFLTTLYIAFFALTPIHELTHWIAFTIDPYREPVNIEVFNVSKIVNDNQWGCVQYREQYQGAWKDEPGWSTPVHEAIAYSVQCVLALLFTLAVFERRR